MNHLTEEQFAELLAASPRELREAPAGSELASAGAHAASCPECTAELSQLRDSLALFREAGTAYADAHIRRVPAWQPPVRRGFSLQSPYWLAASAAAILAAFVPLQMALRHPEPPTAEQPMQVVHQHTASEEDQALLDDVNRELSESVPSPLAALVDPAGTSTEASQNAKQRTN